MLLKAMLDFDSATSLDKEVFEHMTENKMYDIVSSSKGISIDFALQQIGRSLMKVSPTEAASKKNANGRQKDAIFTVNVEETVVGIKLVSVKYASGPVFPVVRKTTRSYKVSNIQLL